MNPDLVDRAIRTSLIATTVTFPFLAAYIGGRWAVGFTLASFWSTANIWVISLVVQEYFGRRRWPRFAFLLCVKFPILYGLGIWGLYQQAVPIVSILIGFHVIFMVLVLKVLSRGFLSLEDSSNVSKGGGARISGREESL